MSSALSSAFYAHVLLPLTAGIAGRSVYAKYRFLKEAQFWPRKKLEDYQNERLREVVEFSCRNIPYYREVFAERGLKPEEIRTTGDLVRLPVLDKALIRSRRIEDFVHGDKKKLLVHRTSGTTGEQGTFYLSRDAEGMNYAAELLFFGWGGFSLGERHIQTGVTMKRGFEKKVKDILFNCQYFSAFGLSDADLEKIRSIMMKKRVRTLIGFASSLNSIASYVRARGEVIPMKTVLSLGETLYPHYREVVEAAFACRVTDTYGCGGEGIMVAGQCERQMYHICMPLVFVEILDGKGERVRRGETGRVVLTRLAPSPMPLIRYDVGDVSSLPTEEECGCGRGFALMGPIVGRCSDIIKTPSGHRIPALFFAYILRNEERIRQYQVWQEVADRITIKVVPGAGFGQETLRMVERKLQEGCRDLKIEFQVVDDIPPSQSGKRRFVVSTIPFQ